jgi:hypothetical protein
MKKIAFITGGIVLFIILFYVISGLFLTCEKPVKSPYVLLEGWIPRTIVEDAVTYIDKNEIDSVFVVGMKNANTSVSLQEIDKTGKLQKSGNTYALIGDGVLGFEIPSEKLNESFALNIQMRGTGDLNYFPHYEVFVNKQMVGSGFVTERDSCYEFVSFASLTDPFTYVLINFDNDCETSTGDRNLYISDIYIDSLNFDSLISDNFFISNTDVPNFNFVSRLNTIQYYFEDLGYDTSRLQVVEVNYEPLNMTLALAKGAKKYLGGTEMNSINIITAYKHSRRSYLNYKNCFGDNIEVGCIPGNRYINKNSSIYDGMDERVSLFFTWIYWWFH